MSIPAEALLDFWFGDCLIRPEAIPEYNRRWYAGGEAFDAQLRERFADALEEAAGDTAWNGEDIEERLARVLLLDQVSRNIHRGTARAFATDPLALRLALVAIDRGIDKQLRPIQRAFLAMPLQHAEDRETQRRSLAYFESLAGEGGHPEEKACLRENAQYARQHADIVLRFGRYPHRNSLLGRESTPEETDYLNNGAPRFGQ